MDRRSFFGVPVAAAALVATRAAEATSAPAEAFHAEAQSVVWLDRFLPHQKKWLLDKSAVQHWIHPGGGGGTTHTATGLAVWRAYHGHQVFYVTSQFGLQDADRYIMQAHKDVMLQSKATYHAAPRRFSFPSGGNIWLRGPFGSLSGFQGDVILDRHSEEYGGDEYLKRAHRAARDHRLVIIHHDR